MLNAAIIGISGYGATHYDILVSEAAKGRLKIVAATVINADEEAEKVTHLKAGGTEIFSDYEAMLAKHAGQLDACFIPTGINYHAPMTIAALKAGANVLVEKPLCASTAEADAMAAVAKASGKLVAIGFQDTYTQAVQGLKQALLDGAIGEVQSLTCYALWPRKMAYYTRNGWVGRKQVGDAWVLDSPAANALAHPINLMLFLSGETFGQWSNWNQPQCALASTHDIENFDTIFLQGTADNGTPLRFAVTHSSEEHENPDIVVTGTKGTATWSINNGSVISPNSGQPTKIATTDHELRRYEMFLDFFDRVEAKGDKLLVPIEGAAKHTQLIWDMRDEPITRLPASAYTIGEGETHRITGIDALIRDFANGDLPLETARTKLNELATV